MGPRRRNPAQYWRTVRDSKKLVRQARIAEVSGQEDRRPHATVNINGVDVVGLMDSGATVSCFGRGAYETVRKCGLKVKAIGKLAVRTASNEEQAVEGCVDASVCFQGLNKRIRFYLIPTLGKTIYLGVDFWIAFNLLPKVEEVLLERETDVMEPPEEEASVPDMHKLTPSQKIELDAVIAKFPSFEAKGLGKTTLIKHNIDVQGAKPSKQRYYAVSPAMERKMYAEVDRMLALGVVEESMSPWNSPVTIVPKANGKNRLCLDARQVNAVTKKDAYPTPIIESIFSRLHETIYISSVDLKDAYWQIELDDDSKEKTAFTVPGRPLYHFTRMPFGLCNASQTMCRLMDRTIPSALRESVFVYIDDLLIVSADFRTHLERLKVVAESLQKAQLTINIEKSVFMMRSIKYLGHIVGHGQIKPDPGRVQSIVNFPQPKTVRQLRRFIGMIGWYRRYIHNHASVSAPLSDLTKKSDKFVWTPQAQEAFESLKVSLTTAPVLTHPDFSKHFFVQCDASIVGVGGVLFQIINGEEHPIAFMSKKLSTAQKKYSVTELECLAALLCIQRFRCYIEGMPFTVITDHAALKWLMSTKDLNGRLARWSLALQMFDFNIEHRKGSANVVPDALSRMEVDEVCVVGQPIDLKDAAFQSEAYAELQKTIKERNDELPDLQVREGFVYKRTEFRTGEEALELSNTWKLWVPDELQAQVIANSHDPVTASHGGIDKTIELIRRHFYWPGLARDVRAYVSNCSICKETKAPNQSLRPPMGKPYPTDRPFQRLYIDLLGPYPRSKSGNTTILIVLDQLSKFFWLKPLKRATAAHIGKYLEAEIFNLVGAPETLLSDNGVQFVSRELKEVLTRYGVKQIFTASHSPQANASERVNRSIIAAIRAYIESDQTTWDQHIAHIASALRNHVHASTGKSPFYVVFGQHMVQHGGQYELLRNIGSLQAPDAITMPPAEFREILNDQVRDKLAQAHERNERSYNTRTRDVSFRPGQEVYIRNFQQSNFAQNFNAKLAKQWKPARIVCRKGSCLYEVEERSGKPIKVRYHAKDIRS